MRAMRMLVGLLAPALPFAVAAQVAFDGQLSYDYDDNRSNAQRAADIVGDRALTGRGALRRLFSLAEGDGAVGLEAYGAGHDRFSGLDHLGVGLSATWRRKLGLGLAAPWLLLQGRWAQEEYSESVRDGTRTLLSAVLGQRFGERVEAALAAAYDRRRQDEDGALVPGISGRPFSLQGRELTLSASYQVSAPLLVYGSASLRHGDVVSSTRRNPEIFAESAAIAADPAFGPDFIAYRLTGARTRSLGLGLSWALSDRAALDLAVARDVTDARGGLDYDGNVYRLSFVYSP